MSKEIIYNLIDDNGLCTIYMEVLFPLNTVFEHEYGTYKVDEIIEKQDGIFVNCERITTYSKLRNLNN
jgi:hypothetical protein